MIKFIRYNALLPIFSIFFLILGIYFSPSKALLADDKENNELASQPFLEILFLANLNGTVENCQCADPSLGGLPQITGIVQERWRENPDVLYIDGGDFLNTYPFKNLNQAILDIYQQMNPSYIVLGDQEFIESTEFSEKLIQKFFAKIIATNIDHPQLTLNYLARHNLKQGKCSILISYLDENAFFYKPEDSLIRFNQDRFNEVYSTLNDRDFVIALYHGSQKRLDWFTESYPKVDLILFGHEQSYFLRTDQTTAIIGGGSDGEYLIQIKVFEKKLKYSFEVNPIPITLDIRPNATIQALVDAFKVKQNNSPDARQGGLHRRQ